METTTYCNDTCMEKLDLDAPLMSTRRLCINTNASKTNPSSNSFTTEASRRVPFLWETAPGISKYTQGPDHSDDDEFLTPKPPPGRWRPSVEAVKSFRVITGSSSDNDNDEDEDDVFLDALDNLSLSESVRRSPPNFLMERFLPAANALAISSSYGIPKQVKRRASYGGSGQRSAEELKKPRLKQQLQLQCQAGARSESPTKACGLMLFFPWSLKHNLCGLKTPRRSRSPVSARGSVMTSTACYSSGWGMPFLSKNRVRSRGKPLDDELKTKPEVNAKKKREAGN